MADALGVLRDGTPIPDNEFMRLQLGMIREGLDEARMSGFFFGLEVAANDPQLAQRVVKQAHEWDGDLASIEHFEDVQATIRLANGGAPDLIQSEEA